MYKGQCLCGAVAFEVEEIIGPFELCHCTRCRKSTGSAFAATVGAKADSFRITAGVDHIKSFELPVVDQPPAYTTCFCSRCGSPVPLADPAADWLEIPAGLFNTQLPLRPERHIYIEYKASWESIDDDLPTFTRNQIAGLRGHDER